MARESVEEKAARLIDEERFIIVDENRVVVSGSKGELYDVTKTLGVWSCPCPARVSRCSHMVVAHRVTEKQTPERGTPEYEAHIAEVFKGL